MTNQPYGYGAYEPYPQQGQGQGQQQGQQQAWPGQAGSAGQVGPPGYGDPYADQQYTQQWQGQTWETQMQPPVAAPAEETSYLPPVQSPAQPPAPSPAQAPGYAEPAAPSGGAGNGGGPEYGPATLAGNTRVTDAQRARAEGRSPIIEPGMQPAALTALLGLLLAGGAALGTYGLLVPLVLLQAVTAAGWFRLNGMWPARQGIALGFLGAVVADAALLVSDGSPGAILGALGVWVLLSLVLQLRSHADPDERMYGLMATVAAAALAIAAGGYLAADADAVTVGAVAVAVAVVVRALPLPTALSVVVAPAAAAGAGFAVGGVAGLDAASGALVGAGAAVCALIGHRVASYDYPSRFVHFTAGVALPLAAAAPAVYVLGRMAV
ncbi:hypothetical protein [Streptomyces capillispiralis]|uniref:Uncharacterized protein n=1 Tax=Streptomyces capillispiralis TaxID=68182 RepID=A0A561THR9_9ACTN|nr:hypothetical protein [Streptomyces capillispiralis]TWF86667.1 hypothetical protein FHX78_113655 [Streptomyces capillispiralis]GHH90929.1 hypothetical protein GCM10017779_13860 [Streptomyces capillispiralis]